MKPIRLRKTDIAVLTALKTFIETLQEPCPPIGVLSRKFGINTDKLKRGFKQLFGVAPYQYVLQLRLTKAKALLRDTELPVADIAFQSGYEHAGNFSAWFKRETGVRPLEWRYGEGEEPFSRE